MSIHNWLQNLRSALTLGRSQIHRGRRGAQRAATYRPSLEVLEDRLTPSFAWDGTYSSESPPGVVGWSSPTRLADVTSDGIRDRIELIPYNLVVRPGRGDGTFGDPIYSGGAGNAYAMAVADFNGDGRLDVFTLNIPSWPIWDGQNWGNVLLGHGDGQFSWWEDHGFGPGIGTIPAAGFGDFFDTGRTDLVVGGCDEYECNYLVLRNNGDWEPLPPPPPPSLEINDLFSGTAIKEGNTGVVSATFTVTLSFASTETITVAYATGDDTAIAGLDYQATSGTLTFSPGETSKTITVPVINDRLAELDEYFAVNLSNPTNAGISKGQGFATIVDDEPRISISDVTKKEGNGKGKMTQFTFVVTLSAAYDQPVTMSYCTVNGTATTGDGDYVAKTGTLTFAPGETTKTITIEVKGDSKKEASETFYLDLFGLSSNASFTKNRGIGTILNDD